MKKILALIGKFTVSFDNSPFTTIDTAIIRSSRLVVFCQKGVRKIQKETPALKTRF